MRHLVVATLAAVALSAAAASLVVPAPAAAQDAGSLKAKAKEVLAATRDAVIHVKAAVKIAMSFGGQEMPGQDQQVEVVGTVVDPSGLVVISEASLNPAGMMEMFGGGDQVSVKSDVGDVKLVMKDGKEIPARLVLRDKDLDLAFVAPNEKGLKLSCVSLDASKPAEALDDIIVVGRLAGNLNRTPAVALGQVTAVVTKPRTFYSCGSSAIGPGFGAGCPVFDATGKTLGILLQRRAASSGGGGIASIISAMAPVVLPTEDVKEVAQQALVEAAKPAKAAEQKPAETPKPEAPKEGK
jgi:S1-C subfamily serine protease